jgi:nitroreductase/NAD-dependent dihydropyrimidine dehydrogenase PreA subunit
MKLTVDPAKCTLCEACVPTCPTDMVRRKADRIKIGRVACIECGHCIAICPEAAISDEGAGELAPASGVELPWPALEALVQRRRTARGFLPESLPRELLEELLEELLDLARWTPTAANCQPQEYIVLTSPEARDGLRLRVEDYYRRLAEALADREHREERVRALGLTPEHGLHPHVLAAVPSFVKAVEAGRDRLFFGAPAVVVVHAARAEVMPEAACSFAAMLLVLAAEARGVGSCITGYASDALRMLPDARLWLGVPDANDVHSVVALGRPSERFLRVPERRPVRATWR